MAISRPEHDDARRALLRRGWLSDQPEPFAHAVLARAQLRRFQRGDWAHHAGDPAGGVHGIASGGFAIYLARGMRPPVLATMIRTGVWFGMGPLITREARSMSFRAIGPKLSLYVPLAALDGLSATGQDAARRIFAITYQAIEIAAGVAADLLIRGAERRVAATLLRATGAAEGVPPDGPEGYMLTQTEIAEMANVSRHMANRTIAAFAARGWVSAGYRHVAIHDPKAIQRISEGEG